jgi:hypothetical protein
MRRSFVLSFPPQLVFPWLNQTTFLFHQIVKWSSKSFYNISFRAKSTGDVISMPFHASKSSTYAWKQMLENIAIQLLLVSQPPPCLKTLSKSQPQHELSRNLSPLWILIDGTEHFEWCKQFWNTQCRFVTQLCLHIWSGGMLVLLASP